MSSVIIRGSVEFPVYTGIRCLMMPYVQGEYASVPEAYSPYHQIIDSVFIEKGKIGFLTIDESLAVAGKPHRGERSRWPRAIHTEAGRHPHGNVHKWGGGTWGGRINVTLDCAVRILLANNLDDSCAIWDAEHVDTSLDGDIGYAADAYPYTQAHLMKAGELYEIGILTPHESIPVKKTCARQFLRIVGSGVHGREEYFTDNPLMEEGGFVCLV